MKLLYFGREQENGYIRTIKTEFGGIVAEIDDATLEYIDWSSFIYAKKFTDEAYEKGVTNSMKSYNEYWTCDQTGEISDTWKPTKTPSPGMPDRDHEGNTWEKTKLPWTNSEAAWIIDYDKSWITGKIATFAYMAYTAIDVDRGPIEKETWDLQYQQALAYKESGSTGTLLKLLADAKGVTPSNFADSIIKNNEEYQTKVAKVLAVSTKLRKDLNNCTTIAQVQEFVEKYLEVDFGKNVAEVTPMRTLFKNI